MVTSDRSPKGLLLSITVPCPAHFRLRRRLSLQDAVEFPNPDSLTHPGKNTGGWSTVIKVDTEGFEGEVMYGLRETLADQRVRAVCVEVHFSILHDRKMDDVPVTIASLLRRNEFRVTWLDRSHFWLFDRRNT